MRVADRLAEGPVASALRSRGHRITVHEGAAGALASICSLAPDLVLMEYVDDVDGALLLASEMRGHPECADLPVVLVVNGSTSQEIVRGLDAGADMCVPWSVSEPEANARIAALVRRKAPHAFPAPISSGPLFLDPARFRADVGGQTAPLDRLQFELLRHLVAYPNGIQARKRLLARVWPGREDVDLRTVDVYVARLRDVLSAYGMPDSIETVRGHGYRWVGMSTPVRCK